MLNRALPLVSACMLCTACVSSEKPVRKSTVAPLDTLEEMKSIALAALVAQEELASIRARRSPTRNDYVVEPTVHLSRTIQKIEWSGPLSVIASDLAREAGYQFAEVGRRRDVIVTVSYDDKTTVLDALRNLGLISGVLADVVVDPERGRVEIEYKN